MHVFFIKLKKCGYYYIYRDVAKRQFTKFVHIFKKKRHTIYRLKKTKDLYTVTGTI